MNTENEIHDTKNNNNNIIKIMSISLIAFKLSCFGR